MKAQAHLPFHTQLLTWALITELFTASLASFVLLFLFSLSVHNYSLACHVPVPPFVVTVGTNGSQWPPHSVDHDTG